GVKIYEWQGKMLHAKTATIDGVWSTVGTSNLDWWSIARDNELNAVILSHSFGDRMDLMFRNDMEGFQPIDWKSGNVGDCLSVWTKPSRGCLSHCSDPCGGAAAGPQLIAADERQKPDDHGDRVRRGQERDSNRAVPRFSPCRNPRCPLQVPEH